MFYATPDQRVRADGALVALALQQHALRLHDGPFRVVLILVDAALVTRLRALAAGAKHLRRHVQLYIRANAVSLRACGQHQ